MPYGNALKPDYGINALRPRGFGQRTDGSQKGEGFLGRITTNSGQTMTELSLGVNFDGEEALIPSIVPSLSPEEIKHLQAGGQVTQDIVRKAVEHARMRKQRGLPYFATPPDRMGL